MLAARYKQARADFATHSSSFFVREDNFIIGRAEEMRLTMLCKRSERDYAPRLQVCGSH